jgi:hypothetical protein
MTQAEIIDMAIKAGMAEEIAAFNIPIIEAFAKLVAAKEREACAKVCEKYAAANTSWTKAAVKDCAAIIKARGKQA